ncbi:hypothetical protein EVAR_59977_1 [Eumeta japonica]|uniref:Uncharacterized protein n=1 Tax=Eumeta variegata TaxID=151549 RepID=A0A4C2A8S0_EUMVA|nr:hypothetical protein EVAR_59977_1 [Eumeta japonica]
MLTALLVQQLNCKCTIRSVSFRCATRGVLVAVCAACWRQAPRKLDLQPPAASPASTPSALTKRFNRCKNNNANRKARIRLQSETCNYLYSFNLQKIFVGVARPVLLPP